MLFEDSIKDDRSDGLR